MKVARFIGNFDLAGGSLRLSDKDFLHQIRNVLRLNAGDEVVLSDGRLNEAKTRIIDFDRNSVEFEILERWKNENESERNIILYCSILKRENFELVIQKATELGAKEIVPIICQHTVKLDFKKERLEKIIREAAEQSGRGIVPILHEAMDFSEAIKDAKRNKANLFFHTSAEAKKLTRLHLVSFDRIGIFVGPEGGWEETEIRSAKYASFKIVSLGRLTLRAETAAIVACFLAGAETIQ